MLGRPGPVQSTVKISGVAGVMDMCVKFHRSGDGGRATMSLVQG